MTDLIVTNFAGPGSSKSIFIREGRIESKSALPPDTRVIDCGGRAVIPGFVDSHTHAVFAGDRSDEFISRLSGVSYTDLAANGGGIGATVAATRQCSEEDLFDIARERVWRMIRGGTTTLEIKSGYGLDLENELKILRVARRIGAEMPITVRTTFLGAHTVPVEFQSNRRGYLDLVVKEMIPRAAALSDFCDVFVERDVFSVNEAREVLLAGLEHGMRPRVHAEQLSRLGGARLAAELGALSADHLDHVTEDDAEALAEAGVVAGLVPGASYSLGDPQAPGKMLRRIGVELALATDCNPGTSYFESMGLVISLAVVQMGLTLDQALRAATLGGAHSLGFDDRGEIADGKVADLVILDAPSPAHLAYRPATPLVWKTIKAGQVVYSAE